MSTAAIDDRVVEELQALEAIFATDIVINREDGKPKSLEINILPATGDNTEEQYVCITMEINLTPNYPDTRPDVVMKNPRGLDDNIMTLIQSGIEGKLVANPGNLIVYELIEVVREHLTMCNLPQGQCVICLNTFVQGDVFIKTPCFHYFHSHCMSKHLILGKKYYDEEFEKLPTWQKMEAQPFKQTCPVCRSVVQFDVDELQKAPAPMESEDEEPFCINDNIRAVQDDMAVLFARQLARGGVIGFGDVEPPPLIITDPVQQEAVVEEPQAPAPAPAPSRGESSSGPARGPSGAAAPSSSGAGASAAAGPSSPARQPYNGPYRGFNRRGKPGRRGRGGSR
ncbi:E3 ubiquitin-protein ligase RNF25 [Colias croceus]|uniref:E3 ubiquitin-protein ligase RNF25 n=1 Tax=Colias crocea TaxID=72248 RepID=UPI001E27A4B0|nr:E3 ubiquitin-protein ligase RNF25 [Colias croceus]